MSDALKKKLEERINRRSFLRGSALAAAAVAGVTAFPLSGLAQDQQPPPATDDKKDEKKEDPAKQDARKDEPVDETKITKKDENGRDYRICPQCGFNMYKQDRTWSCENCGYSHTE